MDRVRSTEEHRVDVISVAGDHPEAPLPCPWCTASVKGRNLQRHLDRAHGGAPGHIAGLIEGVDERARRRLIAVTAASAVASLLLLGNDRATTAVAVAAIAVITALVAVARPPRASVHVGADGVTVAGRLGTMRRHVASGGTVRCGPTVARRRVSPITASVDPAFVMGTDVEVRTGTYIEVADDRRSIALGCARPGAVRSTWADVEHSGRRRRVDVWVDPRAFVHLQYALLAAGRLAPRAPADAPCR